MAPISRESGFIGGRDGLHFLNDFSRNYLSRAGVMSPIIELRNATKTFPGVVALDKVQLQLFPGEIHCLVGENGAGKSTLIKILAGQYKPDAGELLIRGQTVHFHAPADSLRSGIAVIYQDLQLVPHLSVAENISLGQWQTRSGFVDRAAHGRTSKGCHGPFRERTWMPGSTL